MNLTPSLVPESSARVGAVVATIVATLWLAGPVAAQEPVRADAEPERPTVDLTERSERRLVQLDASLTGPREVLASLTADDFELVVGGEFQERFTVDRLCSDDLSVPVPDGAHASHSTVESGDPGTTPTPAAVPIGPRPTFLFYFDQPHLTQEGRYRAIRMARELIPQLIRDGARGSLISNARELETFVDRSADPQVLLDALDRLETSKTQWEPFALQEESRVADVVDTLDRDGTERAVIKAREYAREERYRSDRALRRFSMVLGRMATLDPPKIAVYFADTMRSNPGEHYLALFNNARLQAFRTDGRGLAARMEQDAWNGQFPFQEVIDQAAALGIRLYTIEAQGMTTPAVRNRVSSTFRGRVRDAQGALKGLALETGGRAFVNGVDPERVVRVLREDLECVSLISFDPGDLPRDEPLPVRLRVKRSGVEARLRGVVVVQSDEARRRSKLMAAFGASATFEGTSADARAYALPVGFEDGRYTSLVQLQVAGAPRAGAVWDLGATWIGKQRDLRDASGRVEVEMPGTPVVFETTVRSKPGDFTLIGVAFEGGTETIVSEEIRGTLPDPSAQPATALPTAILQPRTAVFLRDAETRRGGAAVVAPDGAVDPDRSTVFLGLVCWDKVQKRPLTVERALSGDGSVEFEPIRIEPRGDRCASVRDVVRAGDLGEGGFVYSLVVRERGEELARQERPFLVESRGGESRPASASE